MQPLDVPTLAIVDESAQPPTNEPGTDYDRAIVMLTCANCGAKMVERKCKLICPCGYFLSCSDYY